MHALPKRREDSKRRSCQLNITGFNETTGETEQRMLDEDDRIRASVTMEKLKKLKPVFMDNGASTAGTRKGATKRALDALLT